MSNDPSQDSPTGSAVNNPPAENPEGESDSDGDNTGRTKNHCHEGKCYCRKACDFLRRICKTITSNGIAAVAALAAVGVAWLAWRTADEHLVSDTRAWIAIGDIVVDKPFELGKTQEIYLLFGNTGRSPALKTNRSIKVISLPRKNIAARDAIKSAIKSATKCDTLKPDTEGFAVYPTNTISDRNKELLDTKQIAQFVAKSHYLMIAGCFAYETANDDRISEFCRFLDFNSGPDATKWNSTICRYGERAD